jgi:tetratricopeptide (TPR) repeat protein
MRRLAYYTGRHMPVKALEQFNQITPANYSVINPVELRTIVASLHLMMNRLPDALRQLEPLEEEVPNNLSFVTTMAKIKAALNEHAKAAELYKRAAELKKGDQALELAAAKEYMAAGEMAAAQEILTPLNEDHAGNEEILLALAESWLKQDNNKARRYITEAIQINGKNSYYFTILGICEAGSGRTADAFKNYEKALSLDGQNKLALRKMAELAMEQESYKQATSYIGRLLKLTPADAALHIMLAEAYSELDDLTKAAASYQSALRLVPNNSDVMVKLAAIYKQMERLNDAQKLSENAVKANPKNAAAHLELGYFYKDLGRDAKAIAMFKKYLELAPDSEEATQVKQDIADLTGAN